MGTEYKTVFKRLHKYGQDLLFDKVHDKLKVVIEDKEGNTFLANGLLSKYSDKNTIITENLFAINKLFVKFRVDELKLVTDIKTHKIRLNFNNISTILIDGYRYNVNSQEINNQTRDYLIFEITKFKK